MGMASVNQCHRSVRSGGAATISTHSRVVSRLAAVAAGAMLVTLGACVGRSPVNPDAGTADQRAAGSLSPVDVRFAEIRDRFGGGCGKSIVGLSASGQPFTACFDPVQPPSPAVMRAVEQAMRQFLAENPQFNIQTGWRADASGAPISPNVPINLTWSFVPDGVVVDNGPGGAQGSSLFSTLDGQFADQGGRQVWIAQFQSAFDRWAQYTGTRFTRVRFNNTDADDGASWGTGSAVGARGDIRIAMRPIDGERGILAFNFFPPNGDMVLDSGENWANGATFLALRNVVAHELGHGLGLRHTCPANQTKLMEPFLSLSYDGPQLDDIRAVQNLYGDALESNNTIGSARRLGNMTATSTFNPSRPPGPPLPLGTATGISIASDNDFFRVTTATPLVINASATPVGTRYLDLPQNPDGSCPTEGTNTDAIALAILNLDVFNSAGTILINRSAGAAGAPAQLQGLLLSPPGDWLIRVTGTAFQGPQLYDLLVSGVAVPVLAASVNQFPDRIRLTWTSVPSVLQYRLFRSAVNDRTAATQIATAGPGAVSFDDLQAVPDIQLFYWIEAVVGISPVSRPMAGPSVGSFSQQPTCRPDYNADGFLNPDDLTDFITDYFTVPPVAGPGGYSIPCGSFAQPPYDAVGFKVDINDDCQVNTDDLSDFITLFFLGC